MAFVLWEAYELIYIAYTGPSGFIQSDPWDLAIDPWIDTIGALTICFIYATPNRKTAETNCRLNKMSCAFYTKTNDQLRMLSDSKN